MMQPMVHYLPLKKDFSNFDEVLACFQDRAIRKEVVDNAYRDLIASGAHTYRRFIASFDDALLAAGVAGDATEVELHQIRQALDRGKTGRVIRARILGVRFPGRGRLDRLVRRVWAKLAA
jgi:hypothetical protein